MCMNCALQSGGAEGRRCSSLSRMRLPGRQEGINSTVQAQAVQETLSDMQGASTVYATPCISTLHTLAGQRPIMILPTKQVDNPVMSNAYDFKTDHYSTNHLVHLVSGPAQRRVGRRQQTYSTGSPGCCCFLRCSSSVPSGPVQEVTLAPCSCTIAVAFP